MNNSDEKDVEFFFTRHVFLFILLVNNKYQYEYKYNYVNKYWSNNNYSVLYIQKVKYVMFE